MIKKAAGLLHVPATLNLPFMTGHLREDIVESYLEAKIP